MKTLALRFTIAALLALSARADETYKFKVSVVTIFEALEKQMTTPKAEARYKASSEEIRLRMKTQKVTLFETVTGTRWKSGFSSCSKEIADCEIRVNNRGFLGAKRDQDPLIRNQRQYDLGFRLNPNGSFAVRCLRASCWIRYKKDRDEGELSLMFLESGDVPAQAELEAVFPVVVSP